MTKKLCKNCEQRKPAEQCHLVRRHGGGNYRQAGRMIPTTICEECVLELAERLREQGRTGALRYDRWDVISILFLADRIRGLEQVTGPDLWLPRKTKEEA